VLAEKNTGISDFDESQDHVVQGICAESFIAEYLKRSRGLQTVPCGLLVRDPVEPRLAATPDYLTCDGSVNVQLKMTQAKRGEEGVVTAGAKKASKWGPSLPSYIYVQVQVEMAVMDLNESLVVAYHRWDVPRWGTPGDQLGVYRVPRNQGMVDRIRSAVSKLPPFGPGAA
jgi:hypothetical protein